MENTELNLMQEQFKAVLKEITLVKEQNEELREALFNAINSVEIEKHRNELLTQSANNKEPSILFPIKQYEQLTERLKCYQQMKAASVDNENVQRLRFSTLNLLLSVFADFSSNYPEKTKEEGPFTDEEMRIMLVAQLNRIIEWHNRNIETGIEARKNSPDLLPNGDLVDGVTGALIDHIPTEKTMQEFIREEK